MTVFVILTFALLAGLVGMGIWVKNLKYKLDKAQMVIDDLDNNPTHDPLKRKHIVNK